MRKEKELLIQIGETEYTFISDDDYLERIRNGFDPDMVDLLNSLVKTGDYVLDIGANIGCTSILLGESARKVYSFEPSPTTCSFLRRNIQKSNLNNIEILNFGLGSKTGKFTLTFSPSNRSGGFVSNQMQASAGHVVEEIEIRKTDEFVQSLSPPKIYLIKIDVEGFEGEVIKGARSTFYRYAPVIVLELNHWCLNAFQRTSIPDFFDFLRSIFPIILAVDKRFYLDLTDENDSYTVMYHHINHFRFPNVVAAFNESQIDIFRGVYEHGFA